MYKDKTEEYFVDVRSDILRFLARSRSPLRSSNASTDDAAQFFDGRPGIRLEETGIYLAKDISDCLGFLGQFDRECILELSCEVWNNVDPEKLEIAQR